MISLKLVTGPITNRQTDKQMETITYSFPSRENNCFLSEGLIILSSILIYMMQTYAYFAPSVSMLVMMPVCLFEEFGAFLWEAVQVR